MPPLNITEKGPREWFIEGYTCARAHAHASLDNFIPTPEAAFDAVVKEHISRGSELHSGIIAQRRKIDPLLISDDEEDGYASEMVSSTEADLNDCKSERSISKLRATAKRDPDRPTKRAATHAKLYGSDKVLSGRVDKNSVPASRISEVAVVQKRRISELAVGQKAPSAASHDESPAKRVMVQRSIFPRRGFAPDGSIAPDPEGPKDRHY